MKKLIFSLLSTALLLTPINSLAATLDELPSTESSNQWKVVIGKPDNEPPEFNKSTKPDLYNLYSMDIENIGDKNINLIKIEVYRNEPNSTKDYELFTVEDDDIHRNDIGPSFHHHNFPMYTKATKLKVILTWADSSKSERKFREEFVFEQ